MTSDAVRQFLCLRSTHPRLPSGSVSAGDLQSVICHSPFSVALLTSPNDVPSTMSCDLRTAIRPSEPASGTRGGLETEVHDCCRYQKHNQSEYMSRKFSETVWIIESMTNAWRSNDSNEWLYMRVSLDVDRNVCQDAAFPVSTTTWSRKNMRRT